MKLFNMQLSRKQYHKVAVVLLAALILTGFFAYNTYTERKQYQIFLQNSYQKSFREMVTNVETIKVLLDKAEVSASTVNSNNLMTQVWLQSNSAADNLGQLPISHSALSKTEKFLNQIGDFCYAIARKNAANEEMNDDEFEKITTLNTYSGKLLNDLHELEERVNQGKIRFGAIRKQGRLIFKKTSANTMDADFGRIEERFNQYPTMIYDGPFSDNIVEGKPEGLTGEKITFEEAMKRARQFAGVGADAKVTQVSSGRGKIETYGLDIVQGENNGGNISIDITKKGGHVLWMINPRNIPEKKLKNKKASEIAKKFLEDHGFKDLTETYYLNNNNTTVITFIRVEKDVLIYTDMLKVKVALDNGQIVGFDSYQHLMANKERDNLTPKLSEEEARTKISQRLDIERVKLAIIPLPGNKQRLCYEFKGKHNNNDYFVYINAENGSEERILRIFSTENGTLTQ